MARPRKYSKKLCREIIIHMEQGLSIDSFAGEISVCRQSLYNWFELYPEFAQAKDIGMMKSLLFWEKLGMRGINGECEKFKGTPFIFIIKNRFPDLFKDKKELDVSSRSVMSFQEGIDKVAESLKSNPELMAKIEDELIDE